MQVQIRPLTESEAKTLIAWEYQEPYNIYNLSSADSAATVGFFLDPQNNYYAIVNGEDEFLGFCNFGADAQVPGGDYKDNALDIGIGMRPDLTGLGEGHIYAAAVFHFAKQKFPPSDLRVTIAEFNRRAQKLCSNFGFVLQSQFNRIADNRPFIIMVCKGQNPEDAS